jgi:hypothetical protein
MSISINRETAQAAAQNFFGEGAEITARLAENKA